MHNLLHADSSFLTNQTPAENVGSIVHDSLASYFYSTNDSIWNNALDSTQTLPQRFLTDTTENLIVLNETPLTGNQQNWQIGLLFFCILLLTFLKVLQKNYFKNLLSGVTSRAIFNQNLRDGSFMSAVFLIPSFAIYVITISLVILHLMIIDQSGVFPEIENNIQTFFIILLSCSLFFAVKLLLIRLIGIIFKTKQLSALYLANKFLFNTISGIVFLVLLILSISTSNYVFYFIILISGFLVFIFSLLRGILIIISIRKYSLYQIFIYLCTLEILPVLVILKLVIK